MREKKKTGRIGGTAALLVAGAMSYPTGTYAQSINLPESLLKLPVVEQGLIGIGQAGEYGLLKEIKRTKKKGIETDKMNLLPATRFVRETDVSKKEFIPNIGEMKGDSSFEFFDLDSKRSFQYIVPRARLAELSRMVAQQPDENIHERRRPMEYEIKMEDSVRKSWSNAHDSRTRRAIADGYGDSHSIYQSIADYGGCSANVLTANWNRMVEITAAHCIFRADNSFSTSRIRPRRNGSTSPTWGSWTVNLFGYYPAYLDNNCEQSWSGSNCIKHDIALIVASPDAGATPPQGMGWGYRPGSFLNSHTKYRRGYPGCSHSHSPSGCTTNNLYGDGQLSVGNFAHKDHDNWNRRIRFSSDLNPGDSGSGLYYYRNGFPYVFAVTSAEQSCKESCTSSRPNYARRITPQWYDFINTVVGM